jgi:hypothetical protein
MPFDCLSALGGAGNLAKEGDMVHLWKLVLLVLLIPLVAWLAWQYDRSQKIAWIGPTNLEVSFVVTDVATGEPIPGARIEVQSDDRFCEEKEREEFVLFADAKGVARQVCRSTCFGTESPLKFRDTFGVHLPWWQFRAIAEGFEPGELTGLMQSKLAGQPKRVRPRQSAAVVPVTLQRNPRHVKP